MGMTTASERTARGFWFQVVRKQAQDLQGITARLSGVGGGAMVGTKIDGSVWVWDELTQVWHKVGEAGTVDVQSLPEQAKRPGRPSKNRDGF